MKKILLIALFILIIFGLLFFVFFKKNKFTTNKKITVIFDFDSTIVKNETLNDILKTSIGDNDDIKQQIDNIVKQAMNGEITPKHSMNERLKLATIHKQTVEKEIDITKTLITDDIADVIKKLQENKNIEIFIVSGGFKEIILPIAKILNLKKENIYANNFIYKNDIVVGVEENILLEEQGKVKMINKLKKEKKIAGKTIMIGDGWTDLETKLYNTVDVFICFAGVEKREKVINESLKQNYEIVYSSKELLKIINKIIDNK